MKYHKWDFVRLWNRSGLEFRICRGQTFLSLFPILFSPNFRFVVRLTQMERLTNSRFSLFHKSSIFLFTTHIRSKCCLRTNKIWLLSMLLVCSSSDYWHEFLLDLFLDEDWTVSSLPLYSAFQRIIRDFCLQAFWSMHLGNSFVLSVHVKFWCGIKIL